jgi:hypothetical protein
LSISRLRSGIATLQSSHRRCHGTLRGAPIGG